MRSSVALLLCALVAGDSTDVTLVAGDFTDVTLVAGDFTDVTLVAGEQCSNQCGGRGEDWCDGGSALCSV